MASTAASLEMVAKIIGAVASAIASDGLPKTATLKKNKDDDGLPLKSYKDTVLVNGVRYRIKIKMVK